MALAPARRAPCSLGGPQAQVLQQQRGLAHPRAPAPPRCAHRYRYRHRRAAARCGADEPRQGKRFDFAAGDFHQVSLQSVHQQSATGTPSGTVLLSRTDERGETPLPERQCVAIGIGGDSLIAIINKLTDRRSERPMSLDLLWRVLERGRDLAKSNWTLSHVAIVDLRNGVFIGRLFFGAGDGVGSQATPVWDCDCRPSDGLWLALTANCPVYVSKAVWASAAIPVEALSDSAGGLNLGGGAGGMAHEKRGTQPRGGAAQQAQWRASGGAGAGGDSGGGDKLTPANSTGSPLEMLFSDDREPVKRLKRELGVALSEEDYATAARIRDHPYMKMHARTVECWREGRLSEAMRLEEELDRAIQAASAAGEEGYASGDAAAGDA